MAFQYVTKIIMMGTRPLESKFANGFELFNEWTIMVVMYHMICFSDAVGGYETQSAIGYSCIAVVLLNISINLGFIVFNNARLIILALRSKKTKIAFKKRVASLKIKVASLKTNLKKKFGKKQKKINEV